MKKVNTYCDHCGRVIDVMHDYDDLQIEMGHKWLIVDLCTECFDELYVLVSGYCKKEDA